jgi:hypothetical protein
MTSVAKSVTNPNVATLQTDYAFALTHSQKVPSDPCMNIMQSDGTGENAIQCGLACLIACPICQIDACDRFCLRDMGCPHEIL